MSKRCSCTLLILLVFWLAGTVPALAGPFADLAKEARTCGVHPETVDRLASEVDAGALTEADGAALIEPLLAACRRQFPTRPFEEKLEEGLTKRVQPLRITAALQHKLEEYAFARTLLAGRPQDGVGAVLTVVGEGLSRGAPRHDFEAYVADFSDLPAERFLTGADMTSLLGQVGFDYALTRSILKAGFESRALTSNWRPPLQIVLVACKRDMSDATTAAAAVHVLSVGGPLNDVAARLGFTTRDMTGRVKSN